MKSSDWAPPCNRPTVTRAAGDPGGCNSPIGLGRSHSSAARGIDGDAGGGGEIQRAREVDRATSVICQT